MFKRRILFVAALCLSGSSALAFSSYEHGEIGDEAFQSAIAMLKKSGAGNFAKLARQPHVYKQHEAIGAVSKGKEFTQFSFGDLVGIYGDYAINFQAVNTISMLKRSVGLKQIVRGADSTRFKTEFSHAMKLSTNNPTHFSLRAAQAYVRWHRKAILEARKKNNLWRALHYEALALHSFTDIFAFGHLLDNRQLTDRLYEWAKKNKSKTNLSQKTRASMATTAGKVMGGYVNFYHNAYNWRGAMMKNLAGDSWRGFGDKRYRIVDQSCTEKTHKGKRNCADPITERQRRVIVHATATSIVDVFRAASGRRLTVGSEYRAMCHLPVHYWDTQAPVDAENQVGSIVLLSSAMKRQGRALIDHGFDFGMGYLKFKPGEKKGTIKYADYIRLNCAK
ncbi:MAG: hypothetical protein GY761_08315 [Hyphomicrobiales bacterium]|nr:hypothetical protein [Hyphomicrobiales bacterium]